MQEYFIIVRYVPELGLPTKRVRLLDSSLTLFLAENYIPFKETVKELVIKKVSVVRRCRAALALH